MSYMTLAQARALGRGLSAEAKAAAVTASAVGQGPWDFFFSHCIADREAVYGVVDHLKQHGASVYVDWMVDTEMKRSNVSARTAANLKQRMRQCRALIFGTSSTSRGSVWMPWELGYFDGIKPGQVSILPLVERESDGFPGQEYIGLYPPFVLNAEGRLRRTSGARRQTVMQFARA